MSAVQFSKQEIVGMLRRAGRVEAAEEVIRIFPDQIDLDELAKWGAQYGITRDYLISRMGGSP